MLTGYRLAEWVLMYMDKLRGGTATTGASTCVHATRAVGCWAPGLFKLRSAYFSSGNASLNLVCSSRQ